MLRGIRDAGNYLQGGPTHWFLTVMGASPGLPPRASVAEVGPACDVHMHERKCVTFHVSSMKTPPARQGQVI